MIIGDYRNMTSVLEREKGKTQSREGNFIFTQKYLKASSRKIKKI